MNHTSRALLLPLSSASSSFEELADSDADLDADSDTNSSDDESGKDGNRSISTKDSTDSQYKSERGFWWKLVYYESALLAILFSFPLFVNPHPVLQLHYTGLGTLENASMNLGESIKEYSFLEVLEQLWNFSCNSWLGWIMNGMFFFNVFVLPICSFVSCVIIRSSIRPKVQSHPPWNPNSPEQKHSMRMFRVLYPIVSTIHAFAAYDIFALSLFLTIPNISQFTQALFDSTDICFFLENSWGEQCLSIHASSVAGSWYCFIQSIMMNLFCDLTLSEYEDLYLWLLVQEH